MFCGVSQIIYEPTTFNLLIAVNSIGLFKYLFYNNEATLTKIYPTTEGFGISKVI